MSEKMKETRDALVRALKYEDPPYHLSKETLAYAIEATAIVIESEKPRKPRKHEQ